MLRPLQFFLLCSCVVATGTWFVDSLLECQRQKRRAIQSGLAVMPSSMHPGTMPIGGMESIKKKIPLGSRALDFRLHDIATGELVDLAELRKSKPVAIILGSFGCDVICRHFAPLTKLHEKYKDCAHFLFVYVKEGPHSELLPGSAKAEDRLARIRRGLRHFAVPFPCLIDLPNQAVQKAYNGFPMRVLAVDRAGRFAWDSGSVFTPLNLDGLEDWLKGQPASN